jgi:hypothetical protein
MAERHSRDNRQDEASIRPKLLLRSQDYGKPIGWVLFILYCSVRFVYTGVEAKCQPRYHGYRQMQHGMAREIDSSRDT